MLVAHGSDRERPRTNVVIATAFPRNRITMAHQGGGCHVAAWMEKSAFPRPGSFRIGVVPNQDAAYISGVVKQTDLRRRGTVMSRIVATATVLILAFVAFRFGPLDVARMLNPSDILFMLLMGIVWFLFAGIIWFKWDSLREAFRVGRTSYSFLSSGQRRVGSGPPITRGGSNLIMGMFISQQPRSGRSASPDR